MYRKTEGIILRETEYRDHDKLLTVLTRDYGKLTVNARGVRSGRSRLKAACQLLTFSELTLFERQERYTLTEATALEMFSGLRTDIERLTLASYLAQITETVAQEEDPAPELLSLLLNALYALSKLNLPQARVKAVFELRLCCIAGFQPDLRRCVVCGREDCNRFNISQGVLQCATCSAPDFGGIRMPLSAGTLSAMRYITQADARRIFSFRLCEQSMKELNDITEAYLCTRLERGFFTLDMYKQLFL